MENNLNFKAPYVLSKGKITNGYFNFIPVVIGVVFFLYIFGFSPLYVTNISWFGVGDGFQNYIGWQFFRHTPWSFPVIGMSPSYGMDVGSSIVFSDSNPLLAIFFKMFSPLLPETFQYFGIWLLVCCILQSYFLWKIISLFTDSKAIIFFAVLLMMFNPAWINRVAHINLMGHFLILAAIYMVLRGSGRYLIAKWCLLIMVAFSVHFYLAMMVSMIWGANILSRCVTKKSSLKDTFIETSFIIALTSITLYILGYFTVGNVSATGEYGRHNNNILSFLISNNWSYIFNVRAFGSSTFESFNFWGLGILLLLVVGISGMIKILKQERLNSVFLTFLLCLPVFFIIATTNNIAFGNHQLSIELPYKIVNIMSVVRASARFFWPITYCAMVLIVVGVIRSCSKKHAIILISLAATVQACDTSRGYKESNFYFYKNESPRFTLLNKFWSEEIRKYSYIRYVPFQNRNKPWLQLSYIAEKNHMQTDAVYLARFSDITMGEMNRKVIGDLALGEYDNETLYVIRDDLVDKISLKNGDNLYRIDGLNVLAPGLSSCKECKLLDEPVKKGIYIFSSNWLSEKKIGEWNDGKITPILVQSQSPEVKMTIHYRVFTPEQVKVQRLIFKVNGVLLKEIHADKNGSVQLSWRAKDGARSSVITVETPDAIEPRSIGINKDGRIIGFGILSASLDN